MPQLRFLICFFLVSLLPCLLISQESPPKALVWEIDDPWTKAHGATELLQAAGFEVAPLPLDQSPWLLDADLIFLGSFVSEAPEYADYMKEYADDLYNFVDKGHLLVQFTQADQTEAEPPFLPTTQGAVRSDQDYETAIILNPEYPLVKDLPLRDDGRLFIFKGKTLWENFIQQSGFEVLISADRDARFPAVMEGAYGQGRILLASLFTDKITNSDGSKKSTPEQDAFNEIFFRNLATHAIAVREVKAPALSVSASPKSMSEFTEGAWTVAILPDTQVYSLRNPGLFTMQTHWIVKNRDRLNIKCVLHLGDIVNNNTPLEWERAKSAIDELLGEVPIALVPGNHDYGPSGDASTRETRMNEYLDYEAHAAQPSFGGSMEEGLLDNTWHHFEAGGREWVVLALEWGPRDITVQWANHIMSQHPDSIGIMITHAFVNNNDLRYDHTDHEHPQHYNPHDYRTPGGVNDGEELWQKLIKRHNFAFAINGHVLGDGTGYLTEKNNTGTTTHQMLVNYQMRELGGEGYLRLLEFQPDGKTVIVKSYSPLYDRYLLEPDQTFTLELD